MPQSLLSDCCDDTNDSLSYKDQYPNSTMTSLKESGQPYGHFKDNNPSTSTKGISAQCHTKPR